MKTRSFLPLLALTLLAGCGTSADGGAEPGAPPNVDGPVGQSAAKLVPVGSCEEVESFIKQSALDAMNRRIDQAIEAIEKGQSYQCYEEDAAYGAGGPTSAPASGGGAESNGGATQVSGTNNQVVGVDEADFVKNDNKFLYVVSGGALRILEAFPGDQMHEVAKVSFEGEGTPKKLCVDGDRALVYLSVPRVQPAVDGPYQPGMPSYNGGGHECTYGYDCDFSGDGTATKIVVLDVSDRAAPARVRELSATGSLIAARRVGDAVHTVVATPEIGFPGLSTVPEGVNPCGGKLSTEKLAEAKQKFEALRAKNAGIIAGADVLSLLPKLTDKQGSAAASELPACQGVYRSAVSDGAAFMQVISLDMAHETAPGASTIVSRPGAVYASASSLYVAVPRDRDPAYGWYEGLEGQKQASVVHKFHIGDKPADTGYSASGVVQGRVLNQFSMDEHKGNLRIATTTGHVPDPDVESTLTVLEEQRGWLGEAGKIEHIAPKEDIRSVRFDGDRGFVVTFKKTDPLYAFDLADPHAPKTMGELKIPGFSTYMHMMDETHLLTIGYDANDHVDFAYFDGVLLQIFDVSDPKNPTLAQKTKIGTRGSSSEALTNHLAFNFFAPKHLLALPMTICEGGGDGTFGTDMTFSGLIVYDVTVEGGFVEKGRVAHPTTSSGGYDNAACGHWWTQASSEVKRSVVMDDFLYSISESVVKSRTLGALEAPLKEVSLAQ